MAIINGDSWKEALRNSVGDETPMRRMIHKLPGGWSQNNCCVTYVHQVKGRSCFSKPLTHFGLCMCTYVHMYVCIPIYSSYVRTYVHTSWVHCVCFSTFSDVAHAVLDRCMSDNATEENPDIVNTRKYEVTFDFEFLEDWRQAVSTGLVRGLTKMSRRRGHAVNKSTEDLNGRRLDVASSVGSSHDGADDEEKQSTRWKPEGFSRVHHPLLLMVNCNCVWWSRLLSKVLSASLGYCLLV